MGVWAHLVRGVHESPRLVPASGPPGDESLTSSPYALRVTFDTRGCVGHEHGKTLPQKQAGSVSTRLLGGCRVVVGVVISDVLEEGRHRAAASGRAASRHPS